MSPSLLSRRQSTLERSVSCEGVGLHSGEACRARLVPAESGGRVFVAAGREIPATIGHVVSDSRATILGVRGGPRVATVEHLLATLAVHGVDHVRIEVEGPELPALDGSAAGYATLVESAGQRTLEPRVQPIVLRDPVEVRDGERWLRAEPAEALSLDVTIDFATPSIGRQRLVLGTSEAGDARHFAAAIAPARTFALRSEVDALQAAGLALGGSLDNAIVFDEDGPLGAAPLRFPDECVRHKTIDLLGDLALLGRPLAARVIAERGGHALHHALVRVIQDAL